MSKLLVDGRCVELAEHFAHGERLSSADVTDLAEEIQRTVDGWFNERNYRASASPEVTVKEKDR